MFLFQNNVSCFRVRRGSFLQSIRCIHAHLAELSRVDGGAVAATRIWQRHAPVLARDDVTVWARDKVLREASDR